MATKTVEKKGAAKKGATTATMTDPVDMLATEILITEIHRALVRLREPARPSEIVREIGDDAINAPLVRSVMESHPRRFVPIDRRWDIISRYLDKRRPVERTLEEVVSLYAAPMPIEEVAAELGLIYGRVKEHFDQVAPRLLAGSRFFPVNGGDAYGLRSWLLDINAPTDADVLFYNYLRPELLAPFEEDAVTLDWVTDPLGSSQTLLAAGGGEPVDNRIIQWFAWKQLGEEFDPEALYDQLYGMGEGIRILPDHRWLDAESLGPVRARWQERGAIAAEMVFEEPAEPAAEIVMKPLEVTQADIDAMENYFDGRDELATVGELLENVFEVSPLARNFASDKEILATYMRANSNKFLWVGTDRFRAPGTLPPYIGQLPESLTFPMLPRFETADGEILDQMLSDAAFDDFLREQILDPIAQDVNDQEHPSKSIWADNVSAASPWLRLVLKAHHKEIGTFPLAQVPPGFFPAEPNIVELTLRDSAGAAYPIYVDYNVQLVYGLFDVYANIATESGAVFHIEKNMEKPSEYKFTYGNETDSQVFINPNRYEELLEYRTQIEEGELLSTYDLVRHILDHYRKGCSFLTLLTELNVIRRTQRRLLASILSGYTAFHERANRWTFDPKKEPEGFDKKKMEFIIRK
jgi:hypothetical protein